MARTPPNTPLRRPTSSWAVALTVGALLASCGEKRELREWQAADHPAPPAVTPEGQGVAEEGGDPATRAAAALWGIRCATCHGDAGRGDGPGKPPGAPVPDMSLAAFHAARSDAQLAEVITKGRGLMPAFGEQVTEAGITALVQHVRGLRRPD